MILLLVSPFEITDEYLIFHCYKNRRAFFIRYNKIYKRENAACSPLSQIYKLA